MINLNCYHCGERMEFNTVPPWDSFIRLYRTTCIDSGDRCITGSIYRDLPKTINNDQIRRFINNLNKKSEDKAREKLI